MIFEAVLSECGFGEFSFGEICEFEEGTDLGDWISAAAEYSPEEDSSLDGLIHNQNHPEYGRGMVFRLTDHENEWHHIVWEV